jgi:hypothetical protein
MPYGRAVEFAERVALVDHINYCSLYGFYIIDAHGTDLVALMVVLSYIPNRIGICG